MRGVLLSLLLACLLGCETSDEADVHVGFQQSQSVPFQDSAPSQDALSSLTQPFESESAPALGLPCADFWCQEVAKMTKRGLQSDPYALPSWDVRKP
jgi:hypothetical protein